MAILFGFRLGQDVPLRSHEALLAETARNMVLDHPVTRADGSQPSPWLVPNFNGSDRLKKTPLPYWTVAGLARLTGSVDEWTARLPAAVTGFGTVLILLLLLRREEDRLTGLLGVAVLATMAEFLNVARLAQADMPMTFFMTASLASLWMGVRQQRPLAVRLVRPVGHRRRTGHDGQGPRAADRHSGAVPRGGGRRGGAAAARPARVWAPGTTRYGGAHWRLVRQCPVRTARAD